MLQRESAHLGHRMLVPSISNPAAAKHQRNQTNPDRMGRLKDLFDATDMNCDGVIDRAEFNKAFPGLISKCARIPVVSWGLLVICL